MKTFDEYAEEFKSGRMNIHLWNCCINFDGYYNSYTAYIMGEGSEQCLTSKRFNSEQEVRDFYKNLNVQKILWI